MEGENAPRKVRKLSLSQDVSQRTKGAASLEVEQRLAAIPTPGISPFERISDDILRHILSYRMCLREGSIKTPDTPLELYREDHRARVSEQFPNLSFYDVTVALNNEFQALSNEERDKYEKLAEPDRLRFEKEKAALVTPERLFGIMNGLSLVSKRWYNVVGDVMNSNAPKEIISSRDLFKLKSRALNLDLESVCQVFVEKLKAKWANTFVGDPDRDERYTVLELVIPHYGGFASFANLVATAYVQFLIVNSVETIALHNEYNEESAMIEMWRTPCLPTSRIGELFWQAHKEEDEKYTADFQMLIGDLLNDPSTIITEHGDTEFLFSDLHYRRKRDILFEFENQLPPRDFFFGRFGGRLNQKHKLLLEAAFDIHNIAEAILREIRTRRAAEN